MTGRALALAGAGVAAIVASRGFGTGALAILGVGMIALPLVVVALVGAAARGLRVTRRLPGGRAVDGDRLTVGIALGGWARRLGLDRLLEVTVDPGLAGAGAVGVRRPTTPGESLTLVAVRGDHHLPPPTLTLGDPFGLARSARACGGEDRLLVVPQAPELARRPAGGRGPAAGRRAAAAGGFGELDRVRDYQPGDALSRVHWGQTAKRGRLQTKELRAPEGEGRATVLMLDGAAPAGEHFETAVVATAALARHLDRAREPLALVHTGREPVRLPAGRAPWPAVELALARVRAGGERSLALALRAETAAAGGSRAVVVVTSDADGALAGAVAQARAAGAAVTAVLVGPAAALATEVAAAGAHVVPVPGREAVAEALAQAPERARAS